MRKLITLVGDMSFDLVVELVCSSDLLTEHADHSNSNNRTDNSDNVVSSLVVIVVIHVLLSEVGEIHDNSFQ